jgi:hypothetical protein
MGISDVAALAARAVGFPNATIRPSFDKVPGRLSGRVLVGQVPKVDLDVLPFPVP